MKASVIISYYKNLENLKLILKGLKKQSVTDFEAIISEDDNNEETLRFVKEYSKDYNFPIIHVNQEIDDGFRKNMMLNKSIKISNGDTLIFIDGDCIPNKNFIGEYIKASTDGYMLKGRRVNLGEKISKDILDTMSLKPLKTLSILFSDSKKKKEAFYSPNIPLTLEYKDKGLLGCNWGIRKKHLIEINGFDEDYIRAAVGEDTDVEWRLKALGLKNKYLKNKAIVYHLYHERGYSQEAVNINTKLLEKKMEENNYVCLNGLEKL